MPRLRCRPPAPRGDGGRAKGTAEPPPRSGHPRCFVHPALRRCPHAVTGAAGGSAGSPEGLSLNSHRAPPAATPPHPFPHRHARASPAAAACPRRTGRPPTPPPQRQRPGLTAGRARGREFPAMALSLSDPGSGGGPPGPGRARGPFNGGGPARPAARARPAPRPSPLAARPAFELSHWLRAPRPRAPIGRRRGAASPAASCFKVTLSGGRRGQASPAPQPRPDWPPHLLFKRLRRLAGSGR